MHDTTYRGIGVETGTRPYTLWMLQRSLDAYRALSQQQRERVDAALTGTGWQRLFDFTPRHRLEKHHYRLAWES